MSHPKDELPPPAAALADDRSFELARLWYAGGTPVLLARAGVWADPAAWGFVLGEMARDLARLHADDADTPGAAAAALARIRAAFDAELDGDHAGDGGLHAG